MKKKFLPLIIGIISMSISAEVVDNAAIISMLEKGYDTEIIIGFFDGAEECELKAGINDVDTLLAAGADKELVRHIQHKAKMLNNALDGLYWWNANGKPQKLNLSAITKESKGFGAGLLGSAVSIAGTAIGVTTGSVGAVAGSWIAGDILSSSGFKSEKLVIPGESAKLKVNNTNPVFRFVIADSETSMGNNVSDAWYNVWMSSIQSPNEFQLIKLKQKGKKGKMKRVFPSGLKWSAAGFSSSSELAENAIVEFEVRQINSRTYEITFPNGLESGEYAFFYREANNPLIKEHLSVFDFTVK